MELSAAARGYAAAGRASLLFFGTADRPPAGDRTPESRSQVHLLHSGSSTEITPCSLPSRSSSPAEMNAEYAKKRLRQCHAAAPRRTRNSSLTLFVLETPRELLALGCALLRWFRQNTRLSLTHGSPDAHALGSASSGLSFLSVSSSLPLFHLLIPYIYVFCVIALRSIVQTLLRSPPASRKQAPSGLG